MSLGENELREAAIGRLSERWVSHPDTRLIEEFGSHFGAARVDVAVVNGSLWGYELKSDADRLTRLPRQVNAFSEVYDYLTLVVGQKHLERALLIVPEWWGVISAERYSNRILLKQLRAPRRNRATKPIVVAALLWRDELLSALQSQGRLDGLRSATRAQLIDEFTRSLPKADLAERVRTCIKERPAWRDDPVQRRGGGMSLRELVKVAGL